jgi:5-methyltetrahydropteroyltriglutamate--homocysteine methyltransferase
MIKLYLTGLFPRNKSLRRALRDYDKKLIDRDALKKIYTEETIELVNLQEKNDFDFIYDGMLTWQDFLRPLCNSKSIFAGPLIRWFETNFFYRVPLIKDKIEFTKPSLSEFYLLNLIKEKSSICLLDPISFLHLSENNYYRSFDELFYDFSNYLIKELEFISHNHTLSAIHLVSPILGFQKIDLNEIHLLEQFIKNLKKIAPSANISLNLYYLKVYENIRYLSEIQADIIGLDLCYGDREKIAELTKEISSKYSLGLIDSFISYAEAPEYVIREINKIVNKLNIKEEVYLTNSSELDRLPYEIAVEKVNLMGKIKKKYKNG